MGVVHDLGPDLAPQGMVRQPFDLLGHLVPSTCLNNLDQARVQSPPPLLQEAAVGHLMRQGMLEGVLRVRVQTRLIEKLGGLQMCEAVLHRGFRHLGDGVQ